ncbi:hypothetical protein F7725_023772 [Dissostichus mawsoni]|uniref:WD repeat-containing protein 92 n=1 Tax=Dissostichus mawsoni TaxID=36200 RepID=A0A7J5XY74_DISMA|nr:hypothetical protein F7725_023772 [Dissostichus mawsoni]
MQIYEVQQGEAQLIKEVQDKNLEVSGTPVFSVKAHKEIINSIDGVGGLGIGDGAPEIVTGSRDGHAFNDQDRCVCAGYDNGDIKLFDLRNMSLRWETNIKNGVCCVEFDRKDINMNKLVATSLEGKFHVFDMRTQHPTKGFSSVSEKNATLSTQPIASLDWSPDKKGLCVCSGFDQTVRVLIVTKLSQV